MVAPDLVKELAQALAIAGALLSIVQFQPGRRGVLAIALTLMLCVYYGNPAHRVYSFHGFWHHAIVYEILNGRLPPGDPLAAGELLRYPWGMHLVAAELCRLFQITPPLAFAWMNASCLALLVVVLFRIAAALDVSARTATLGVAVALFGITPLNYGALAMTLQPFLPVTMDFRGTPLFAQFTAVNGASFGLLFYGVALDSLLAIFARDREPGLVSFTALFVAAIGSAFFYPLMFVGLAAASAASVAVLWLRGATRRRVIGASAAVGLATLVVLPYLLRIAAGRDRTTALGIDYEWTSLFSGAGRYALTLSLLVAVLLWKREASLDFARRHRDAALVLLTAAATTGTLYVVCGFPYHAEYKLLMLSAMTLGLLASPALGALYESRPMICFLIVAAFLLPLSADLSLKLNRDWWQITDPFVENATALEASSPAQQELHGWIRTNTTTHDAFIDSWLTIPVFAQRPLFLAVNWRMPHGVPNGWFIDPRVILHDMEGLPLDWIDAREALVKDLLLGSAPPPDEAFSIVHDGSFHGDLYVVTRSPRQTAKLAADPRFERAFENARVTVYRLKPTAYSRR